MPVPTTVSWVHSWSRGAGWPSPNFRTMATSLTRMGRANNPVPCAAGSYWFEVHMWTWMFMSKSKVVWTVEWSVHIGMTFNFSIMGLPGLRWKWWCWWCAPQPTTNQGLNGYMGERNLGIYLGYHQLNHLKPTKLKKARIRTNSPNSWILARFTKNRYNGQLYLEFCIRMKVQELIHTYPL